MGLFSKKSRNVELELPPPPPPVSDEESNNFEMPPLPQAAARQKMPFELNLEEFEKELPPVPDLEELKSDMPTLKELGKNEIQRLEFPEIKEESSDEEVSAGPIKDLETEEESEQEEEQPRRMVTEGPIYLNVGSYKDVIENINSIKNKVKESEDYMQRLNEVKNAKDKYFEQLRVKLEDLQRKSLYIDKSLFEVK